MNKHEKRDPVAQVTYLALVVLVLAIALFTYLTPNTTTGLAGGDFDIAANSSSETGNVNVTINKTESWDAANVSTMINYTIVINNTGGTNTFNMTLTEIYPNSTIFVNATPTPIGATNSTFILGNLSNYSTYTVNVSLIIMNVSPPQINNTVNLNYLNETGGNFSISVSENTTVKNGSLAQCLGVITSNVTLINDLYANYSDQTCIQFGASSITFDCDGHALHGFVPPGPPGTAVGTGTGVYIPGGSNQLLRRCEIVDFRNGVNMTGVTASTLSNNTIHRNREWGTRMVTGLSTDLINDSQYFNNSVGGIYTFLNVGNISIANNNITNNTLFGIYFNNTHHSTIAYNNITKHQHSGVFIRLTSPFNYIYNNTIGNGSQGIQLIDDADSNIIRNNTFGNNTIAINISDAGGSTLNSIYGNWIRNSTIAHANTDDATNEFDLNTSDDPIGNFWDDITLLDITDGDSDGYGDAGTQYPYRLSNGAYVLASVVDDGPILNTVSTPAPAPESPAASSGGGGGGCSDLCIKGTSICATSGRMTCVSDYDADACTEYKPDPCAGTSKCVAGKCVECVESWVCDEWTVCKDGVQTRACFDVNACGTTKVKPLVSKPCALLPVIELPAPITPLTYGEMFAGTPIACAATTKATSSTSLSATSTPLSVENAIPFGYRAATEPFSLGCDGDDIQLTLQVPDSFTDLKVLKCNEEDCAEQDILRTDNLREICGGTTLSDSITVSLAGKSSIYTPEIIGGVATDERPLSEGDVLSEGRYAFAPDTSVSAKMTSLSYAVPQPANPSLVVLGTPLILDLSGTQAVGGTITLPITPNDNIQEGTVGIYALEGQSWTPLGGTVQNGVISITADDFRKFAHDGHIILATIGGTCNPCDDTVFERAYESPGAKDAVILVHGALSNKETFEFMLANFRSTRVNMDAWTFSYPATKNLDELGTALANELLTHAANYDRIYIVGHSAGGLIAEQALWTAYERGDTSISKVRKAILIGTPGGGSPAVQTFANFLGWAINHRTVERVFNVNSELIQSSVTGKEIPQVPGIDYQVIAGTRSYAFNEDLFRTEGAPIVIKNDGIISVPSAQKVGQTPIDNACKNYYELNLTHTDLIDNDLGIRVTERIITSDTPADDEALGFSKYVQFTVTGCDPTDEYIVVGKELKPQKRYDPSGCACGNGWCNEGESDLSCPGDCADVFTTENLCVTSSSLLLILLIAATSIALMFPIRHLLKKRKLGIRWLYAGEAMVCAVLALMLLLRTVCEESALLWVIVLGVLAVIFTIAIWLERRHSHDPFGQPIYIPRLPRPPTPPAPKPFVPVKPALPKIIPPELPKMVFVPKARPMWPEKKVLRLPRIEPAHSEDHPELHASVDELNRQLERISRDLARPVVSRRDAPVEHDHEETHYSLEKLNRRLDQIKRDMKAKRKR